MANSKQSLKRARQAVKRNERNTPQRTKARTLLKKTQAAIESKNVENAKAAYAVLVPHLDKLARKGLLHQNKVARHKRRLNQKIKLLAV